MWMCLITHVCMLMLIEQISLSRVEIVPGKMVIHLIWKAISVIDYDKVVKKCISWSCYHKKNESEEKEV